MSASIHTGGPNKFSRICCQFHGKGIYCKVKHQENNSYIYKMGLHYQEAAMGCITKKQPSRSVLKKGALKISSKFTGEHPCRSVISIKLQSNFTEITLRHGFSPVNLLLIFRTLFTKSTYGRLLLITRHQ